MNPLDRLDRSCMHNNNCWQLLYQQLTNSYHKQLWFTVIQSCRLCLFVLSYYYCPYSPLTLLSWQIHVQNFEIDINKINWNTHTVLLLLIILCLSDCCWFFFLIFLLNDGFQSLLSILYSKRHKAKLPWVPCAVYHKKINRDRQRFSNLLMSTSTGSECTPTICCG